MDEGTEWEKALASGARLDPAVGERLPKPLRAAVDFHGHLCPGLVVGYRAATLAMARLQAMRGVDEELIGVVETDACGVDAFQLLTGCTVGKGNLIFKDYGKEAYTLARRTDGSAVRVVLSPHAYGGDPDHLELLKRVVAGKATSDECAELWRRHTETSLRFLEMPVEELMSVTEVEVDIPSRARVFDSVVCSYCGESVMEPRSRLRSGKPSCIPCAVTYGRGWEIYG